MLTLNGLVNNMSKANLGSSHIYKNQEYITSRGHLQATGLILFDASGQTAHQPSVPELQGSISR
jgi:hypothetical protein